MPTPMMDNPQKRQAEIQPGERPVDLSILAQALRIPPEGTIASPEIIRQFTARHTLLRRDVRSSPISPILKQILDEVVPATDSETQSDRLAALLDPLTVYKHTGVPLLEEQMKYALPNSLNLPQKDEIETTLVEALAFLERHPNSRRAAHLTRIVETARDQLSQTFIIPETDGSTKSRQNEASEPLPLNGPFGAFALMPKSTIDALIEAYDPYAKSLVESGYVTIEHIDGSTESIEDWTPLRLAQELSRKLQLYKELCAPICTIASLRLAAKATRANLERCIAVQSQEDETQAAAKAFIDEELKKITDPSTLERSAGRTFVLNTEHYHGLMAPDPRKGTDQQKLTMLEAAFPTALHIVTGPNGQPVLSAPDSLIIASPTELLATALHRIQRITLSEMLSHEELDIPKENIEEAFAELCRAVGLPSPLTLPPQLKQVDTATSKTLVRALCEYAEEQGITRSFQHEPFPVVSAIATGALGRILEPARNLNNEGLDFCTGFQGQAPIDAADLKAAIALAASSPARVETKTQEFIPPMPQPRELALDLQKDFPNVPNSILRTISEFITTIGHIGDESCGHILLDAADEQPTRKRVMIVTGQPGSGKTYVLRRALETVIEANFAPRGIQPLIFFIGSSSELVPDVYLGRHLTDGLASQVSQLALQHNISLQEAAKLLEKRPTVFVLDEAEDLITPRKTSDGQEAALKASVLASLRTITDPDGSGHIEFKIEDPRTPTVRQSITFEVAKMMVVYSASFSANQDLLMSARIAMGDTKGSMGGWLGIPDELTLTKLPGVKEDFTRRVTDYLVFPTVTQADIRKTLTAAGSRTNPLRRLHKTLGNHLLETAGKRTTGLEVEPGVIGLIVPATNGSLKRKGHGALDGVFKRITDYFSGGAELPVSPQGKVILRKDDVAKALGIKNDTLLR